MQLAGIATCPTAAGAAARLRQLQACGHGAAATGGGCVVMGQGPLRPGMVLLSWARGRSGRGWFYCHGTGAAAAGGGPAWVDSEIGEHGLGTGRAAHGSSVRGDQMQQTQCSGKGGAS